MNSQQLETLSDTLDELDRAIETSDRAAAQIALSFARRLIHSRCATSDVLTSATQIAAAFHKITEADLLSRARTAGVAEARHLAFFLARQTDPRHLSYSIIGAHFARDHGSIIYGCQRIQGLLETEPDSRLARELPNLLAQMPKLS